MGRKIGAVALALLLLAGCGSSPGGPPEVDGLEDLAGLSPQDFTDRFSSWEGTQYGEYAILEEEDFTLTVYTLTGTQEGPGIYIVAGVHGDEPAGWYAGTLARQLELGAGTVYLLSPANPYGAENDQRKTRDGWDLNRGFPGDPAGADAHRMAVAIFSDIREKEPALVLDLHEAQYHEGGRDNLGSSLICQQEELGELLWDLLLATQEGELCSGPFALYHAPPAGSLNYAVGEELGIPVITVETDRRQPLGQRIADQMEIMAYLLEAYGLN